MKKMIGILCLVFLAINACGCAALDRNRRLESQVADLKGQLQECQQQKDSELERAKKKLEATLGKELKDAKARLEMTERGLVITFLAEVFFDSGKDVIKSQGKGVLEKVAGVLNKDVPESKVAIEGHTDTDPIKYSGWKSNWELSSARALAVLHYFIDEAKVKPERLCANAYGQFSPVADNDTTAGKQKNRRVEIVILPHLQKKSS